MRRMQFAVLLLVRGAAATAQPITLGNGNMPGSGDTLRYTNVMPNSLPSYQQGGANVTWDFSNVTSTSEGVRSFKSALQTPYFFFFFGGQEYGELVSQSINLGIFQ